MGLDLDEGRLEAIDAHAPGDGDHVVGARDFLRDERKRRVVMVLPGARDTAALPLLALLLQRGALPVARGARVDRERRREHRERSDDDEETTGEAQGREEATDRAG